MISCDISFAVLVKIAYISSNWKTLNPDPTSDRSITTFSPDNVLIMKKTFIVIAVVSVLLTVFAACVKEQYPQPDDISAGTGGHDTVDEAKIYFFRHSDGSVSALNRDRLYLQKRSLLCPVAILRRSHENFCDLIRSGCPFGKRLW